MPEPRRRAAKAPRKAGGAPRGTGAESRAILALNAFDPARPARLEKNVDRLLDRRIRTFGPMSMLFYDRPLQFVRGEGVWMYDAAGTAYLDVYNNVPSVGHSHPRVAEAIARQAALLSIHTRYLHETIIAYAERLLATLPKPIANVAFTCTGSESNDLALRVANAVTGRRGVVVTESAYHGNSAAVTDISPSSAPDRPLAPHVRAVPAPDPRHHPGEDVGERFAANVRAAIDDLEESGVGFSALVFDSIFSSDGVFADPPGFLAPAVKAARKAGGLVIADEVQPGFSRTGSHMWGFERHGIRPDMVTMGKPMGNGFPIGAVAGIPEHFRAFAKGVGYFNTFGGNPVAAAAGMAVLDVLAEEKLQANARKVGAHLMKGLKALAARHAAITEVRGTGLYIGVELADAETATSVINALREKRILIGAAGPRGDVLKIRPPLCLAKEHADMLVAALDDALTAQRRG